LFQKTREIHKFYYK